MSEPTERPPSPIPVPWPFRPPHALEPSHPLYNHVPREREHERKSVAQRMWDDEWEEVDREYLRDRERGRRMEGRDWGDVAESVMAQGHQRPRNYKQQSVAQSLWDAEREEVDRQYLEARERSRRTKQSHPQTTASPMRPQGYQGQHDPSADSRGDPRGGRERWIHLGRSYARDNPGSEWVQVPKPMMHPETDIYGFAPRDPFYRPHLRYMPREDGPGDGDAQRGQAAMPPVNSGPPQMPPPQTENGDGGGHAQPINHGSNPQSMPRPPSPPPNHYRPREMSRDVGPAGHGFAEPGRSLRQDQHHDLRHPVQPNEAKGSTGRSQPLRPRDTQQQQHQFPATSEVPPGRLETREDPWEFLFGSKGYVTVASNYEPPFLWDWKD